MLGTRPALIMGLLATAVVLWWMATSRPEGDSEIEHMPAVATRSAESGSLSEARAPSTRVVAPVPPPPLAPRPASAEQEQPATKVAPEAEQPPPGSSNLPQRQGPVDELAQRFAGESRSEGSQQAEANARKAFTDPTIPPDMLRTIECRRSICRAELRWSEHANNGYVLGLTQAVGSYSAALGIASPGNPEADGRRSVVVYWSLAN